ncbi:type II secretion system protein [Oleiharenicola lentus]|uniref:Type II secretion system protein n=1 Tax=Oleiharenicola lentus TaxID=2508720 RepID=A0A4Q1CB64_9BACT|nr:type II secretion system protein [Oleiharenicola lentus]RXK56304.1 type II secretion system protein [Oleiharenicola lentus]
MRTRGHAAFTLLELLAVIALIGLLAALIFPAFGAARRSAGKAKTKVQFAQWTAAIESFRAEYGYYPAFDASGLVNGGVTPTDHLFHDLLAARKRDGSALAPTDAAAQQNRKLLALHLFGEGELDAAGLVRDAFENTALAVLTDRDLDGVIKEGTDFTTLPAVGGLTPGAADFPPTGIRAGVIFYAPVPGDTAANPGFIFSWK